MLHHIHTFIHRIGRLVLLDRAADPAANGEIQRNATHVKVYSGGAVRNLSDVGASANHALGSATHTTKAHAELTGVGTGDHHAQLHAAAHKSAGGDVVLLDELGAPTDVTTLNATTLLHGLLLKLGGGTTNFLRADGTWAAPGGGTDQSAGVTHSVAQSIASATWTTLAFDTETASVRNFDTNAIHDTVTNNSRMTVPAGQGGKWLVIAYGNFAANGTGRRVGAILVTGEASGANQREVAAAANAGATTTLQVVVPLNLAAGDYVQFQVYQDSGGALNILQGTNDGPRLSMLKVLG